MNKELEKFMGDTDRRITALDRLLANRDDAITELSRTIGDLVSKYQQQGRDIEALRAELRARPVMPALPVRPPVVDTPAVAGRIEQYDHPLITVSTDLSKHVEIPSESQFKNLVAIVAARYPKFAGVDLDETRRAFIAVGHLNRMPAGKLNMQSGVTGWTDIVEDWLRAHRLPAGGIGGDAVMVAVLAHNDVEYSSLDNWPYDVEFGLCRPGGPGRLCSNSWKALLYGTELLRSPTPVQRIVDTSIGFQNQIPSW